MNPYQPQLPPPRRPASIVTAALGGTMLVAGIVMTQVRFNGATISQWNGLCTSTIGQFGQLAAPGAARNCGLASFAEHAVVWAIAIGTVLPIAGLIVFLIGHSNRASNNAPWLPPPAGWPPPGGWAPPDGAAPPSGWQQWMPGGHAQSRRQSPGDSPPRIR
jgi:hypothetical protein